MSLLFLRPLTCTCLVCGHVYYAYLKGNSYLHYSSSAKCQSILVLCPGRLVVGQNRPGLI